LRESQTAGEIIIASKRIRLGLLHALTSSALQRTGAALELECLKQSRFSVRAKLNTLELKKVLTPYEWNLERMEIALATGER
jgi:hypothetical protein